ncbi:hypothetical protein Q5752_003540 [Cryptotrichosporon argae]
MRLSFRKPQPDAVFSSFLGILDIKLGCEIVLLFGLINKVAGVYGLITIFVGGSFLQLLFYGYSIATLFAFQWALRVVKSESTSQSLLVAHLYTLDHAVQSLAHYLFFRHYWYAVPHDGRRVSNSQAQQDLIDLALSRGEIAQAETGGAGGVAMDELRAALAGEIWRQEKGYAVATLLFGWLIKLYFIFVLYSYAAHLRTSTYHALPTTSRSKATRLAHPDSVVEFAAEAEPLRPDEVGGGAAAGAREAAVGASAAAPSGLATGVQRECRVKVDEGPEEDFSWD